MAEDVAVASHEPSSNPCCNAWKNKYIKLKVKYSEFEARRNALRQGLSIVNEKYNVVEKENEHLKQALEAERLQVTNEKEAKERESSMQSSLENEVSACKSEILSLQQSGGSVGQAVDDTMKQLQGRLTEAEMEINRLKENLEKERSRADTEKKKAETERKRAQTDRKKVDEALKKVNVEKNKLTELKKLADIEKKNAKDSQLQLEKLKLDIVEMKSKLAIESAKAEEACKEIGVEIQNTFKERKRAELATTKVEELRKLVETNLKMAMAEKGRADDLSKKLEEEKKRAVKLENEICEHLSSCKLGRTPVHGQITGGNAGLASQTCIGTIKGALGGNAFKSLEEKELRKRAVSEMKKAEKQRKIAEEQKRKALEERQRADQLSKELGDNKKRINKLQEESQKLASYREIADSPLVAYKKMISESATMKLLKKQLKFEKMLVKHAEQMARVEMSRNNVLRQELFSLKQGCLKFQQHLDFLDSCFLNSDEGIQNLEKLQDLGFRREHFSPDPRQMLLADKNEFVGKPSSKRSTDAEVSEPLNHTSGIDSKLEPLFRGSQRKMLENSAINSSSAYFSDGPLVVSQERGAFSLSRLAKLAEVKSNTEPTITRLSNKTREKYDVDSAAIDNNSVRSPMKSKEATKKVGQQKKRKKIRNTVESIEKLYARGQNLHLCVSKELSMLHDILHGQKVEPVVKPLVSSLEYHLESQHVRPYKKSKTCHEEALEIHPVHDIGEPRSMIKTSVIENDAYNRNSPPVSDQAKVAEVCKVGANDLPRSSQYVARDPDELASLDYMKLLDLDNEVDEETFCAALERPLSPTLPEIEFQPDVSLDLHNSRRPADESLTGEFSNIRDEVAPTCQYDGISVGLSKYFVVFSDNKERSSISRILQATTRCLMECTVPCLAENFLPSSMPSVLKAEDLSQKERVCVFFSLVLQGISANEMKNFRNILNSDSVHSMDSFSEKISKVFSDVDLRRMLIESSDLFELLALIENFLLHRKFLVCGASEPKPIEPEVNLVVDGNIISLHTEVASLDLLVAGAILLSSLCSAVDNVGFVCETSFKIFMMQDLDPQLLLIILHVFAHLCGSKLFALEQFGPTTMALKSLVMLIEEQSSLNVTISSHQSPARTACKIWSCQTCPFSEAMVSLDDTVLLLLDKLQKLVNTLDPGLRSEERINEASYVREAALVSPISDEYLCASIDVLSLVELIACFKSWEWTYKKIVSRLLELLESCVVEHFSAAIIILLGHLGRVGVNANGYGDAGVEKLKDRLYTFLQQGTSRKSSSPLQFATGAALLGLSRMTLEQLTDNKFDNLRDANPTVPADAIKSWFFSLSCDQRSFFRQIQAASLPDIRTRYPTETNVS